MSNNFNPNIPNLLILIRPKHFGFNSETAESNRFQQRKVGETMSSKAIQDEVIREFDKVLEVFDENSIDFYWFEDSEKIVPDAIFPNNWIAQLPGGIVTCFPMFAENRRNEIRSDVIEWIKEHTQSDTFIDLSNEVNSDRYLEGTGSIVFDHFSKKAYACESDRTTVSLFEAYCSQIGYAPVSFESLDLRGHAIYHTNVMMSIARDYCVVNLDSIQNQLERSFLKISLEKSGKEIIPISYQQMNSFAANVFEVINKKGESCLIMSTTAYASLNEDQIDRIECYSKIVSVDIPLIEKIGGGGIRCMLIGLFV